MAVIARTTSRGPFVSWLLRRIIFPAFCFLFIVLLLNWNSQDPGWHHEALELHPIERLHFEARNSFDARLAGQSRTLEDATKEYRRRYKIKPPPGFQKWFEFAQRVNSSVIDDYDTIFDDLKPFRSFLRNRCDFDKSQNKRLPWLVLTRACIKEGRFDFDGVVHTFVLNPLREMAVGFLKDLPEMCFEVNYYDEPRIVAPYKDIRQSQAFFSRRKGACVKHSFFDTERQEIWPDIVRSCPPNSAARRGPRPGRPHEKRSLNFIENPVTSTDICGFQSPPFHGFVRSPATAKIGEVLKPVLSPAKLSSFQDILFPSIYRWNSVNDYNETEDLPWERKASRFYWRGSTTGGMASDDRWKQFHRQNFVDYIRSNDEVNLFSKNAETGQWETHLGSMADAHHLIDVNFTAIIQCLQDVCIDQKRRYGLDHRQPATEMWKNKLVFDIDGNSYSGRFYDLLKSQSAVLKQALFREWHDERLVPWLHYIPISMDMTELAETLRFLTTDGDDIAARIAEAGREWANRALRREDMQVYMYRLLLEMGRRD